MAPLRVAFMGTAPLSCASLRALADALGFQVVAVVTQPDRPKGRSLKLQPTPVKELALRCNLPVLQPERARSPEFIEQLRACRPDLIAVAAYGQILSQDLLDMPRFGCLNVHTSLLPKYRGAGPIQWAILNDEKETGVTIMKMDVGLDTGPLLARETTPIHPEDTSVTLHDRLAQIGAALLVRTIPDFVAGKIQPQPQPSQGVTYAPKIKKQDGHLDWAQPARTLWNRVRGLLPWPGAFTFLPGSPGTPSSTPAQPHLLKIWQAEIDDLNGPPGEILRADKNGLIVGTGHQALRLLQLQREGGIHLSAQQFLAGHPLAPGQRFDKP